MKTQKALGVRALAHYSDWKVPATVTITDAEQLPTRDTHPWFGPTFARPCPVRPRHGFVESRVCRTVEEVRQVWDEARAADPEAELMLMPPIDASCSAILAGDRLAIGPGHDGATAGHGVHEVRVFPPKLELAVLEAAGLTDADTAFVELVATNAHVYAVQLRAGPALPSSPDYVPAAITVTHIVAPHDDLTRWEAEVPTFAAGTVVVATDGSTLACHAAIHCVLHGVPFITTFRPAVGDQLAPTTTAPPFVLDTDAFFRGSAVADQRLVSHAARACQLAVLILHQWPALRTASCTASRLLGFACRALARAGTAICAGEARHYSHRLRRQRKSAVSRSGRIQGTLALSLSSQRRALTMAGKAFDGGGWRSGFGGQAWQDCASAVDRLWRAQVADTPVEANLVAALNRVVNVAHNNGALLSKLVDPDFLNNAASNPTRHLVARFPELFDVLSSDVAPAIKLPGGGRVKRPAKPKYDRLHVHAEPGGIKAQLWNADESTYVSHHVAAVPSVIQWIESQGAASRSRYYSSSRYYVSIELDSPITATDAAVLQAVLTAMGGAS